MIRAWSCTSDEECGNDEDFPRVCAPFTSGEATWCFPSCEDSDAACPDGYTCRSTGGGDENKRVCFPGS